MLELAEVNDTKTWDFYIVPDGKERLVFELKMQDEKTNIIGTKRFELNVIPEVGKNYLITLKFDNS